MAATSSNEQAIGIEQIIEGMLNFENVVQSNTAFAEESASAAEQLSSQAIQLKNVVGNFKFQNRNGRDIESNISPNDITFIEEPSEKALVKV